ncbi:hypothetical protein [Ktedonobacter racemifer]|uniref:hypothetical protein n=1 Tax=Ktedonobacter racemifer TaxID=363277 RepID=UPI001FCBBA49|nr:hypothetical protein [Ktedonobacter racemifer]
MLADRGPTGFPLVKMCRDRQWHDLLRVCKEHTCQRNMGENWSLWCRFDLFLHRTGQQWYGRAKVWQEETIEAFVSACWKEEFKEG